MANHPSALKRAKQNKQRRLRNVSMKSRIRTTVKKVQKSLETGALESARPALTQAISLMDRASSKGIVHRRTASRKISRLSKKLHQLSAPAGSTA